MPLRTPEKAEPAPMEIADKDISLTFAKGMEVLEAFENAAAPLTIPDLARSTGINRSVTRRLVLTLVRLGYLTETGQRAYAPSPKVLRLASGYLKERQFGRTVQPVMAAFSKRLGDAISLAVRDGTEAIYVAYSPGDPALITSGFGIGSRLPLSATAIGRALLAFCEEDAAEEILAHAQPPFTQKTITDPEAIRAELAAIRERGYALVTGEYEPGVTSIAVPVLGAGAVAKAALGIVGPTARFEETGICDQKAATLRDCAETLESFV
ncbi:IclR family transcriptional regulator [Nisaea acidiphila]|uniref:IclR family transcriptional regulator n=1 Tax=Nisaea acidiphila TaxID=1862145 RepID=A0A9J7AQ90_9PROT|nr:IclR family transcriptional regulator [Nisaea acidiphila]UUX49334.1 IclR family transcriptional regulator [Nisaea acidiphila]